MQLTKFGLGLRFAALSEQPQQDFARKVFEGIFSVLTLSELEGLSLYGGADPYEPSVGGGDGKDMYLAVIMGGKLKQMRKVFAAIEDDAALGMYLAHTMPYIENNRLSKIEGLAYYGQIHSNGRITGGDGTLDGLTVPKKRGKRKPVGKGIRVLLAPEGFTPELNSVEAIKRLTVAARKHFQGVKLVPVPVNCGGPGFVADLVTACDCAARRTNISLPEGEGQLQAYYGVLRGKTAAVETALTAPAGVEYGENASSRGTGELIRRALDEGLRNLTVGVHSRALFDCGMGCARALGMKFFDAEGKELSGCAGELRRVASADAEYLHPRIKDAVFTVLDACQQNEPLPEGAEGFYQALSAALGVAADPALGAPGTLAALTGGRLAKGLDPVLDVMDFQRLLKGVALVVTGCPRLDASAMEEAKPIPAIVRRCAKMRVPVAVITASVGDGAPPLYSMCGAGVMTMEAGPAAHGFDPDGAPLLFDGAADRMFRLIRMGRDVEKIGAPKKPRLKPWFQLLHESWQKRREK